MIRFLFIIVIILLSTLSWAINPLPESVHTETGVEEKFIPDTGPVSDEEPPPPEIQRAIETEIQMKEEVIQRKTQEELKKKEAKRKEILPERVIPPRKAIPKGPSLPVIITALVILLVAFFIYRKR